MPFPTEFATYTVVHDLTCWPSGALRGGTSDAQLPIGVQVTARPWRDDVVLAVMAALEEGFGTFPAWRLRAHSLTARVHPPDCF